MGPKARGMVFTPCPGASGRLVSLGLVLRTVVFEHLFMEPGTPAGALAGDFRELLLLVVVQDGFPVLNRLEARDPQVHPHFRDIADFLLHVGEVELFGVERAS